MDLSQGGNFWLTILFRGAKSPNNDHTLSDEYIEIFERNNFITRNLPILEFSFKNLDKLEFLLRDLLSEVHNESHINGLVITSPRVVKALSLTLERFADHKDDITSLINREFVFVVGEKTAEGLRSGLNLECNQESVKSGNSKALSDCINTICDTHPGVARFNLIYPKGNLADLTIENSIKDPRIKLKSVVVYETKVNSTIRSDIEGCFRSLRIPEETRIVRLNHIFFSPSGVHSFSELVDNWYIDLVKKTLASVEVEFYYSAIGKTTEAALIGRSFEVFSVAEKPNAANMFKAVRDRIVSMSIELEDK